MEIRYRKILGSLIILCLIYIAISPLKSDEYTLLRSGSNDEGVNYQTSEIIDKNGKVVHQWVTHFTYSNQEFDNTDHQLLKFFPNGDVIVLTYQKGLARIDLNSNVIWNIEGNFHHDTQITDDKIYTLMWKNRYIESNNETLPIMDEILVTLDYHGNILKEKSLYQIFKKLS